MKNVVTCYPKHSHICNGQNIQTVMNYKFLGILITSQLSFHDHANNVSRKNHSYALPYLELSQLRIQHFFYDYLKSSCVCNVNTHHRFGHPHL